MLFIKWFTKIFWFIIKKEIALKIEGFFDNEYEFIKIAEHGR